MRDFEAEACNMKDLANYRPTAVLLSGLLGALLGLACAGGVIRMAMLGFSENLILVVLFAALSYVLLCASIGRVHGSFEKDCFLRAGAGGISFKFPERRYFSFANLAVRSYKWGEIDRIVLHKQRVNFIPINTALHIHINGGKRIVIDSVFFDKKPAELQEELLTLAKGQTTGTIQESHQTRF
jgi:hypothetical protein